MSVALWCDRVTARLCLLPGLLKHLTDHVSIHTPTQPCSRKPLEPLTGMEMRSDENRRVKTDSGQQEEPGPSLLSDSAQWGVNSIVVEADCRVVPSHRGR